jgi:hypothetical protein
MKRWIRLAILLSVAWLLAMGMYALFSWRSPTTVPSAFVDWWYTYDWDAFEYPLVWHQSFDWLIFSALVLVGLAMIWLFSVGLVWATGVRVPKARQPQAAQPTGVEKAPPG